MNKIDSEKFPRELQQGDDSSGILVAHLFVRSNHREKEIQAIIRNRAIKLLLRQTKKPHKSRIEKN